MKINALAQGLVLVMALAALSACSNLKVAEVDPETGYFPGGETADVVKSVRVDLDQWRPLLLATGGDFVKGQSENIGFFEEVMDSEDLQDRIVRAGLQDKVPSVDDKIGVNNAYRHYKEFLWLRFNLRQDGRDKYAQFILTNPETLDDYLIVEKYLDYFWTGVNDKSTWYPLFNSIIDYIKSNSDSY